MILDPETLIGMRSTLLRGVAASLLIAGLAAAQTGPAINPAADPVVDPYPGATPLPPGTIATVVQPPGINSRIGPGATPRGVAFPVAGQLLQGTRWRATQSAPATQAPPCSRGWIQLLSLQSGQEVVAGNRDVWICRGDAGGSYVLLSSTPSSGTAAPVAPSQVAPAAPAPPASAAPVGSPTATAGNAIPLPAPDIVIAGATGPDAVTLNWNPPTVAGSSGIAGYRIERCTGANCTDFREIGTTPRPPFADPRLASQTTRQR